MKAEIPDEVVEFIDRTAMPVLGTYTASSLYNFVNMLAELPASRSLTLLEALVQIVVAGFGALGTAIGGVGIIVLYKWRHEAAMLKIANEHIVTLRKIAVGDSATTTESTNGVSTTDIQGVDKYIESLPYGKPTKAAANDEPTVDLK